METLPQDHAIQEEVHLHSEGSIMSKGNLVPRKYTEFAISLEFSLYCTRKEGEQWLTQHHQHISDALHKTLTAYLEAHCPFEGRDQS
jgi:hypothetical protein